MFAIFFPAVRDPRLLGSQLCRRRGSTPACRLCACVKLTTHPHAHTQRTHPTRALVQVTGIVAGANISGDLKNPGRAIPRGTLYAVGGSTVVYLMLVVAFGATLTRYVPCAGVGRGGAGAGF